MDAATAFALVAATHAGFQVTVTTLVYPALATTDDSRWTTTHDAHSRRIAPLVVVLYGSLLVAGVWYLTDVPTFLGWTGLAFSAAALATTAAGAAPLHSRLSDEEHRPANLRRLLDVDRVRCAAVVAAGIASVAAVTLG